jgi:uncharacterized membrane protein HdeD (DUF308 family)
MTNRDTQNPDGPKAALEAALVRLAPRARQVVVIGAIIIALGSLAIVVLGVSRTLSLTPVGAMMALAALLEMGVAHHARGPDGRATLWHAAGVTSAVGALLAIAYPLLPSYVFTTGLGAALMGAGWARLRAATLARVVGGKAVTPVAAAATMLLGLLVLTRWPGENLAALGYMLALTMIATGWGYVGLGVSLKRATAN